MYGCGIQTVSHASFFEALFYERHGPSSAINREVDDTSDLLEFLNSHQRTVSSFPFVFQVILVFQ